MRWTLVASSSIQKISNIYFLNQFWAIKIIQSLWIYLGTYFLYYKSKYIQYQNQWYIFQGYIFGVVSIRNSEFQNWEFTLKRRWEDVKMLKTSSVIVHLRSNGMAVKSVLSKFATLKAKSFKSIKFDLCGATHRNSGSLGSFL